MPCVRSDTQPGPQGLGNILVCFFYSYVDWCATSLVQGECKGCNGCAVRSTAYKTVLHSTPHDVDWTHNAQ